MTDSKRTSRRRFISGVAGGAAVLHSAEVPTSQPPQPAARDRLSLSYPRRFSGRQLKMIAFPLGGIGTGTISLGGRGQLRDWEIFNRPDKGNCPMYCFFTIWAQVGKAAPVAKVLESRIQPPYEVNYRGLGWHNAPGLPRLDSAEFEGEYPFGRIRFQDGNLPLDVSLEAFTPLVPLDEEASGYPLAVLRYTVKNPGKTAAKVSIAYSQENPVATGGHQCDFREEGPVAGLLLRNPFVGERDPLFGSFVVAVCKDGGEDVTYLRNWKGPHLRAWPILFWDDFKADGRLTETGAASAARISSLCVRKDVAPGEQTSFTFLLAWRFPNRTPARCGWRAPKSHEHDVIGNHYCQRFADAWAAAREAGGKLPELERRTRSFARAMRESTLPAAVVDAAMGNLSTLRTNTCFRTADGRFYGFEGCADQNGCCFGNCTHVWNYEQATAFLFPALARSMRESELGFNTDEQGCMSFRQMLPDGIERLGKAAADGQMGCLMKLYRDWQLCGDTDWLRRLWPQARKALEFAWISNGWDSDRDGVMEGVQHNTYDIEFYGPNPQCGVWYLGALRAGEQMAQAVGDAAAAREYRRLFETGSRWIDANLFNGEYYEQKVRPHPAAEIPEPLVTNRAGLVQRAETPPFQVGQGCLVDQLVGQYFAHVCGLGALLNEANVRKAIGSVYRYNFLTSLAEHESLQRVFALNDEAAMLICSFPKGNRPQVPFWFFSETMTGFEYQAAVHLIYEGLLKQGLEVIEAIRERYDGERRNPWNEAECGHHYSRAMASWAAVLALSGFQYSAVEKRLALQPRLPRRSFRSFWSVAAAWGTVAQTRTNGQLRSRIEVSEGHLELASLEVNAGAGASAKTVRVDVAARRVATKAQVRSGRAHLHFEPPIRLAPGETLSVLA